MTGAAEITADEHMNKFPDQWYIGGQPKPDTEAERLFSHKNIKEIPHCGNCTRQTCPDYPHKILLSTEIFYNLEVFKTTKKYGCLSHPRAREWINREVIEELERIRDSGTTDIPTQKAIEDDGL